MGSKCSKKKIDTGESQEELSEGSGGGRGSEAVGRAGTPVKI